jgi:hypothetical protein
LDFGDLQSAKGFGAATRFADLSGGLISCFVGLANLFAIPPQKGAETIIYLASSSDGYHGSIFLQVPPDNAVACGAGQRGGVVALGVQRGLGKPQGLRVPVAAIVA